MVMVVWVALGAAGLLEVLLERGEIGLGAGEVAGLEILGQLIESLSDGIIGRIQGGIVSRICGGWGVLLKRGEIALGLGEVAGLQVLAELLELLAELLELGLSGRRTLEEAGGGNSRNGHC